MKVKMPVRYKKIFDVASRLLWSGSDKSIKFDFEIGFTECYQDVIGAGCFDMDPLDSFIKGKSMEIDIPIDYKKYRTKIEEMAKVMGMSPEEILTACFVWCLGETYPALKETEEYGKDSKIKKLVDEMVHDVWWDTCEEMSRDEI